MNHTSCAGSPQPHVSDVEGCPDQTCHHSTTAGTVKQASATTWKPIVRRTGGTRSAAPGGCSASPWSPGSGSIMSGVGCVDTSIPLVTAAERTAGRLRNEARTACS